MLHSCIVYDRRDEYYLCAAAFLKAGVERGDRCIFATDSPADAALRLAEFGLGVRALTQSGSLLIVDARDVYLPNRRFSVEAALGWWCDHLEEAMDEGRPGLCGVGDLSCIIAAGEIADRVVPYELEIDRLGDLPISALCCYPRSRFRDATLRRALSAHPTVHVDGSFRKNGSYLPQSPSKG